MAPAAETVPLGSTTLQRLGIGGVFLALVALSFVRNVHWDEFYFLSHVHAWLDGRLDRPMQTFFVHGFAWLPRVSDHEVSQIVAARLVMLGCLAGTCWAIFRIGSRLADADAARLAVLGYLTSGFVIPFGTGFRADPIAACLLMMAVAVMMTTRMRAPAVVSVAVLSALAVLVTVKAALYLPVYLGALIYRADERGVVLRIMLAGGLAVVLAATGHFWHASGLVVAAGTDTASNLHDAFFTTLLSAGVFPRKEDILLWGLLSLPSLVLMVQGLRGKRPRRDRVVLCAFALPLLALVVYRNAYPYFFPFLAPPLLVVAAAGVGQLQGDRMRNLLVAGIVVLGLGQVILSAREDNSAQRDTLGEVHRLFPDPVPYIDQYGMVSSFPRQGFFMSTWGLQNYREAGLPAFADIIARNSPPLLLADRGPLAQALRFGDSRPGPLLPEDQAVLHESYVHYAGIIWLAGRAFTGSGVDESFSMPMPGNYRVESAGPVVIDGITRAPGDEVALGRSAHRLLAPADADLRLIWATAADTSNPPDLPDAGVYSGFWRLF